LHSLLIVPKLAKQYKKLEKRDPVCCTSLRKKGREICIDPTQYKNLNYPLNDFKRVHVCAHFVLYFSVDEKARIVTLVRFENHE
jgi:mRNA-degrading endonuclease RelE of RelBE toxin-antitoxin system